MNLHFDPMPPLHFDTAKFEVCTLRPKERLGRYAHLAEAQAFAYREAFLLGRKVAVWERSPQGNQIVWVEPSHGGA